MDSTFDPEIVQLGFRPRAFLLCCYVYCLKVRRSCFKCHFSMPNLVNPPNPRSANQWPFRKTGSMGMGTLVSGSKHRGRFCRSAGVSPPEKNEIMYAKSFNVVHFGQKMVRSAVHNSFLSTLTMETQFLCVPVPFYNGNGAPMCSLSLK